VTFRGRLFLAILLPATLLVVAAVVAGLLEIQSRGEEAVRSEFGRTEKAVVGILADQRSALDELAASFRNPVFEEIVSKGRSLEARKELAAQLEYYLQEFNLRPDYLAAFASDGGAWVRHGGGHRCGPGCRHADEADWSRAREQSLFLADGLLLLGLRLTWEELPGAGLVIGKGLKRELESLAENLGVRIALLGDGGLEWKSGPDVRPARGAQGSVRFDGRRFIARSSALAGLGELALFRPMGVEDGQRRRTFLFGVAGLLAAILIAGGISLSISGNVSRPVELLVEATRRVGGGDYDTKVRITRKDEIGRLGESFNTMTEGLKKRQEVLDKTLSRDVAEELLKGTERGGERRQLTIVFMDIRGYTSGTEGMDPADVLEMLNELMELLAGAIQQQGGIVNKFLGDGLMAMFGAPKPMADHALKAVRAAMEMQGRMSVWNEKRRARGLPNFYSGIGINTGTVVCGKVGATDRLEYTLIGEEVNLASRICGKAAPRQVLVTKQTVLQLGDSIRVRELEPVQVKGLSYPVHVFEVLE
jgi:class 3 adenylate cyclase